MLIRHDKPSAFKVLLQCGALLRTLSLLGVYVLLGKCMFKVIIIIKIVCETCLYFIYSAKEQPGK